MKGGVLSFLGVIWIVVFCLGLAKVAAGKGGKIYLSELSPKAADVHGGLIWDTAYAAERPMVIAGKTYKRGLTMCPHATGAHAVFPLDGKYTRFHAVVGLMDYCQQSNGVIFRIKLDKGVQVFDSGPLLAGQSQTVDVDVKGFTELRLEVDPVEGKNNSDHASWADAYLLLSSEKPVPIVNEGETLLEDHFENGNAAQWHPVRGGWSVTDGRYSELSDYGGNDFEMWTTAGEQSWDNYAFQCDVKTLDGLGSIYLASRWLGEKDHYELEFVDKGTVVNLNLMREGRRRQLASKKNVCADGPHKRAIKLRIEVQGEYLRGFVDEKLVVEAWDDTFDRGKIALGGVFRQPMFDNVKVVKLGAPAHEKDAARARVFHVKFPKARSVFQREEKTAIIEAVVSYSGKSTARKTVLQYGIGTLPKREIKIPPLKPDEETRVELKLPVERIRAGDYELTWMLISNGQAESEGILPLTVVRQPNPRRLKVFAWAGGNNRDLAEHGFTTFLLGAGTNTPECRSSHGRQGIISPYMLQVVRQQLDEGLKYGMEEYLNYSFYTPEGVTHKEYSQNISNWFRDNLADLPAFSGINIFSEVESRGSYYIKDYPDSGKRFKAATGLPLSSDFKFRSGTSGVKLKDFPVDGVIPDKYPAYVFYKWFWMEGRGWTKKFREVADAFKSWKPSILTFHDPALRMPSLKNRCKGLDMINHWHYTTHDPKNLAFMVDSLFAAAAPGQQVSHMIQLLWPVALGIPKLVETRPDVGSLAPRSWIAPSPHVVRETTWILLSRPINMLAYHGIATVKETRGSGGYLFSNPETYEELKRLAHILWKPYGPFLSRLERHPHRAAFLASTATQVLSPMQKSYLWDYIYYGRYYEALQNAHIPTDVIFEDDIIAGALDQYELLVLPRCEVLPRSVYERIVKFAKTGKTVLADDWLVPDVPGAIKLKFSDIPEKIKAAERKKKILKKAAAIRSALKERFELEYDADSPEVIMNPVKAKGITYLFVINDKRRPGNYVGQFGNILDEGVPQQVTINIKNPGHLIPYDMLDQVALPVKRDKDQISFALDLGPCGGKIIALYPRRIAHIKLSGRKKVTRKGNFKIGIDFSDETGKRLQGVQPFRLEITDGGSRINEYSGYYAAENGRRVIEFPVALNDSPGFWEFEVEDLTSGLKSSYFVDLIEDKK